MCLCLCLQVRVDKWNNFRGVHIGGCISVGVVTQSPDDITLPNAWELLSAVVVLHDDVKDCGTTEVQYSLDPFRLTGC